MKNILNTLSNVSDFFSENRYIYRGGPSKKPKVDTTSGAGADFLLREVDKEAAKREMAKGIDPLAGIIGPNIKSPINITKKQFEAAQKRGAKMRKRAKEKFGRMDKSPAAIAKSKEYKRNKRKTLTKLAGELALKGPESNWTRSFVRGKKGEMKTVIDKKVARAIGNALQNLPNFELSLAKYYDLVRDELGKDPDFKSETRSLQRKLEKELMAKLRTKASDRLLAYLLPIKMGPVKVEGAKKPTRAQMLAARKKAAESKRLAALHKRLAKPATDAEIARLVRDAGKEPRKIVMRDRPE